MIEAGSRARLVVHAYGLRAGKVEEQRGVHKARGKNVEVRTDGQTGFNVDGERVQLDRARFRVEQGAFALVHG